MKVRIDQLFNVQGQSPVLVAIDQLASQNLSLRMRLTLDRIAEAIGREAGPFNKSRRAALDEHSLRKEKDFYIFQEDIPKDAKPEQVEAIKKEGEKRIDAFNEAMETLGATEVELPGVGQVKFADLEVEEKQRNIQFSKEAFRALKPFILFEEELVDG